MPGTDPAEACRVIMGELPDLPHLPELPARGPGADLIGRTAALLVDIPAETTARGWKLTARPGRDQRRALSFWSADLDAAEEAADGYDGAYKIQVCGPWTLAAALELSHSVQPVLADAGAVADVTESLAEGVAAHVADVRKRIPGANLLVQLDEPALPAALAGTVPTASGLAAVAAADATAVRDGLGAVLAAAQAFTVVHCCASEFPFLPVMQAGAEAVSFDLAQLRDADLDAVAEAGEAGLGLVIGAVPTTGLERTSAGAPRDPRDAAAGVATMWRRTGLPAGLASGRLVVSPACGLAGASPDAARAVLAHCREAARILPELIEDD
jgi:methionine synthase II (cobalamin-independent)